ncbi:hypothetical protein BT96DRAFT_1015617 [Gymnopus androsaceus JB14]|uniref:RanBD1 domain-containing protein n=1 Tax=Gymnopus androsaceus JB14 TaxID=1447944 RepID=A0A6A4I665_9AGAR|nr:hypothetical protein BT96DRAFT_1015617 [Gymnopus androsaceus JB14]
MFPVSDLNFVCCGMATFAATVGYVYAKRRRIEPLRIGVHVVHIPTPTLHGSENKTESENENEKFSASSSEGSEPQISISDITMLPATSPSEAAVLVSEPAQLTVERGPSLKRKRMDDHDENNNPLEYPYNLAELYPNKRCKTPPPLASSSDVKEESVEPVDSKIQNENDIVPISEPIQAATSTLEETTQVVDEAQPIPQPNNNTSEEVLAKTELTKAVVSPERPPAQAPSTPKSGSTTGFESFAISAPASFSFGNATLASGANMRPVWSTSNNFRKRHSFIDKPDDDSESGGECSSTHTLGLGSRGDTPRINHVTGEEDEDVESELKGVKLFVKRGSQGFSNGVLGQVKYLSNKKTSNQRVLFRRDLGKVSMNTRLQPTVRCTFDTQECILRILLAETASAPQEIVVYALKPGRFCSRKDFQTFAESVMGSGSLKMTEPKS